MDTKDDKAKNRDERLEELAQALQDAQLMLLKQSAQLDKLSERKEGPSGTLAESREQLSIVTAERDQLQKRLLALERMQTETIALPDGQDAGGSSHSRLPTIQELMAELRYAPVENVRSESARRLNGPSAEAPETEMDEMIAPEVIAPEIFEEERLSGNAGADPQTMRLLVHMDSDRPVKVPLLDGTMTMGRAESANIHIDGLYISRIHARIICRPSDTVIVDAGSTNGFKVNSVATRKHTLKHGDVITVGSQRFTFIDLDDNR